MVSVPSIAAPIHSTSSASASTIQFGSASAAAQSTTPAADTVEISAQLAEHTQPRGVWASTRAIFNQIIELPGQLLSLAQNAKGDFPKVYKALIETNGEDVVHSVALHRLAPMLDHLTVYFGPEVSIPVSAAIKGLEHWGNNRCSALGAETLNENKSMVQVANALQKIEQNIETFYNTPMPKSLKYAEVGKRSDAFVEQVKQAWHEALDAIHKPFTTMPQEQLEGLKHRGVPSSEELKTLLDRYRIHNGIEDKLRVWFHFEGLFKQSWLSGVFAEIPRFLRQVRVGGARPLEWLVYRAPLISKPFTWVIKVGGLGARLLYSLFNPSNIKKLLARL